MAKKTLVSIEALLEAKMDRLTEEVISLKNTLLKILDNQPKRLSPDFCKM